MAEMAGDDAQFWRNLFFLSAFARSRPLPPLNRYRSSVVPRQVDIPAQRTAPAGVPAAPRTKWGSR